MNQEQTVEEEKQQAINTQNMNDQIAALDKLFHTYPAINLIANEQILLEFVAPGKPTFDNLEAAMVQLGSRLSTLPRDQARDKLRREDAAVLKERNQQVLDENNRLIHLPKEKLRSELQADRLAAIQPQAPIRLDYTREQLLKLPARTMRALIFMPDGQLRENGRVREAVDRIIQGR